MCVQAVQDQQQQHPGANDQVVQRNPLQLEGAARLPLPARSRGWPNWARKCDTFSRCRIEIHVHVHVPVAYISCVYYKFVRRWCFPFWSRSENVCERSVRALWFPSTRQLLNMSRSRPSYVLRCNFTTFHMHLKRSLCICRSTWRSVCVWRARLQTTWIRSKRSSVSWVPPSTRPPSKREPLRCLRPVRLQASPDPAPPLLRYASRIFSIETRLKSLLYCCDCRVPAPLSSVQFAACLVCAATLQHDPPTHATSDSRSRRLDLEGDAAR